MVILLKNSATCVLSQEASSAKPQIQIQLNKVFSTKFEKQLFSILNTHALTACNTPPVYDY